MIQKLSALKIISACIKYNIAGDAYAFGDQVATFNREWAVNAWERLSNGLSVPDGSNNDRPPLSSDEFFKFCGFSSYTDIDYNGKAKILLDLGQPLPEEMYARADLLYDGGVIEHIPNCFQAMCNAVLLVKKGGILIEQVPTTWFGDCYYTIQPLLLRDFYGANGFEMIECLLYYNNPLYYDKGIWRHIKERNQILLVKIEAKAKRMIRPYIPRFILERAHRMKSPKNEKAKKKKTLPMTRFDNIPEISCLDPFDPKDVQKINYFGTPPWTIVIYIGIKRSDTKPENICVPTQEGYSSVLETRSTPNLHQ